MTVLTATNLLFEWFSKNDSFQLEEDVIKIIMVSDHPKRDRAAVIAALSDLKAKEIISQTTVEDQSYWVLKQPFVSFPQTVEIQPLTALAMGDLINNFCEIIQDETDACDSTNITPKDINNIILIAEHFSSAHQENLD